MREALERMKNVKVLEPTVNIRSALRPEQREALRALAGELAAE